MVIGGVTSENILWRLKPLARYARMRSRSDGGVENREEGGKRVERRGMAGD